MKARQSYHLRSGFVPRASSCAPGGEDGEILSVSWPDAPPCDTTSTLYCSSARAIFIVIFFYDHHRCHHIIVIIAIVTIVIIIIIIIVIIVIIVIIAIIAKVIAKVIVEPARQIAFGNSVGSPFPLSLIRACLCTDVAPPRTLHSTQPTALPIECSPTCSFSHLSRQIRPSGGLGDLG